MTKWDLFEVCKTGENSKVNQHNPPYQQAKKRKIILINVEKVSICEKMLS